MASLIPAGYLAISEIKKMYGKLRKKIKVLKDKKREEKAREQKIKESKTEEIGNEEKKEGKQEQE